MDWQDYYIEQTRHLWNDEEKELLEELVSPVPEAFRDVAKAKIAGKIGEPCIERKSRRHRPGFNHQRLYYGHTEKRP